MIKKKLIFAVMIVIALFITGCGTHVVKGWSSNKVSSAAVTQVINPNGEDFAYIGGSREVDGDIVTITYRYRLIEKEK